MTTNLPGMPLEYHNYVYLFDEETTNGYYKTLDRMINTPKDELDERGEAAKNFVLQYKNNRIQTQRIIKLVHSI